MVAALALERTYTPDEVESWEDAGAYELDDCGRLIERPMGAESDEITVNISFALRGHVARVRSGRVIGSQTGLKIFEGRPKRLPRPDVLYISNARLARAPKGYLEVAPELIVEVVSPGNGADEMRAKAAEYLAAGVELVWVAFPSTRTVMVYRRSGVNVEFGPNDTITGENVLPGFEAKVSSFFPE